MPKNKGSCRPHMLGNYRPLATVLVTAQVLNKHGSLWEVFRGLDNLKKFGASGFANKRERQSWQRVTKQERETGKRQTKQLTGKALASSFLVAAFQRQAVSKCQEAACFRPSSLRGLGRKAWWPPGWAGQPAICWEPLLLDLTESAVRRTTGVRGHRYASVSLRFPGFSVVRHQNVTWSYNYWLAILLLICLDHFVWNKESGFVRLLIGSSQLVPRNPNM